MLKNFESSLDSFKIFEDLNKFKNILMLSLLSILSSLVSYSLLFLFAYLLFGRYSYYHIIIIGLDIDFTATDTVVAINVATIAVLVAR